MALNLVRNSKVLFTTNVDANGKITETALNGFAFTPTPNTFEIQVLDGFSFSQNTNTEQVTISEAGTTPKRGQRSFNTSLAPVDFSFSTYIRPKILSSNVVCEENVLWNALMGTNTINTELTKAGTFTSCTYTAATNTLAFTGTTPSYTGAAIGDAILITNIATGTSTAANRNGANCSGTVTAISPLAVKLDVPFSTTDVLSGLDTGSVKLYSSAFGVGASSSAAAFHNSAANNLQKFGLLIVVDNVTYAIDNCALNEATIDFGLDGIATAAWTGQATALRQLTTNMTLSSGTSGNAGTITGGGVTGTAQYRSKITDGNYITNKLSTVTLKTVKALGSVVANTAYTLALTGGSITISNNITYITPSILGIVNSPITYYTGTRSVTGTLNAYLNTGTTGDTGTLLSNMLDAASTVTEPMFALGVQIGGSNNGTRVEVQMPAVSIGVPAINTEQVVSTAITFTAAPSDQTGSATTTAYNLDNRNEVLIKYFSAT
jgi:hypothetical protein